MRLKLTDLYGILIFISNFPRDQVICWLVDRTKTVSHTEQAHEPASLGPMTNSLFTSLFLPSHLMCIDTARNFQPPHWL